MLKKIMIASSTTLAKSLTIFALMIQNQYAYAAESLYKVDVYGTKKITSEQIERKFHKQLTIIANRLNQGIPTGQANDNEPIIKATLAMHKAIMSMGDFAFVNISPVTYSKTPVKYITIDIVEKKDKSRLLSFLPNPTKNIPEPSGLISQWENYEMLAVNLIYSKKENTFFKTCPAHHCIYGFEHPQLKKYQEIFSQAEKNKMALVDIARNDKNPIKRAAAVYLLAHIKSQKEVVNFIIPSIYDSNSLVRNNALRVLMDIAMKDKNLDVSLNKLIAASNFPNTTDRNKSLLIILALINKTNAPFIKETIGPQLIDNLKLQQPINHVPAYEILKKISGKNYAERDYQAWENWLKQKN